MKRNVPNCSRPGRRNGGRWSIVDRRGLGRLALRGNRPLRPVSTLPTCWGSSWRRHVQCDEVWRRILRQRRRVQSLWSAQSLRVLTEGFWSGSRSVSLKEKERKTKLSKMKDDACFYKWSCRRCARRQCVGIIQQHRRHHGPTTRRRQE